MKSIIRNEKGFRSDGKPAIIRIIECDECGYKVKAFSPSQARKRMKSKCLKCHTPGDPNPTVEMYRTLDGSKSHPLYQTWANMKNRCSNPNHHAYPNYGGRGISVCEEWKDSFWAWVEYMGSKPGSEYSIDRIENDGNYEPGNVKWSTASEQIINQRQNERGPDGKFISRFR